MTAAAELFMLIDGPLSIGAVASKRQRLVSEMAQELIAKDSFRNEADAIRTLYANGRGRFHLFDVMSLIDDARQIAAQEVVAREMSHD